MTRTISRVETAKLVRKALKAKFPGHKFSVRSESYSMGSSINVFWTDGPTQDEVSQVTSPFAGCEFDAMQDLKVARTGELDGEPVRFGADFVSCHRSISDERKAEIAADLKAFVDELADTYDLGSCPDGAGVDRDAALRVFVVRPQDSSDGKAHWGIGHATEWAYTLVGRMHHITSYPATT